MAAMTQQLAAETVLFLAEKEGWDMSQAPRLTIVHRAEDG